VASLPTSREACHRTGPRGGAPAGRHVAALVMIEDRFARRQQVLAEVMAALAASATVQQAGAALAGALNEHLDASVIGVCRLRDGHLSLVHQIGYPAEASDRFAAIALDEPLPFAEAARTGRPVAAQPGALASSLPRAICRALVGHPGDRGIAHAGRRPGGRHRRGQLRRAPHVPVRRAAFLQTVTAQAALAFDRAATTEAATATAARLRRLVDGLSAVVWDRDADTGQVEYVNDRVESLLGYPVRTWLAERAGPACPAAFLGPA
jgi:PAS domain-containing protein